jgi:hypothetical protein
MIAHKGRVAHMFFYKCYDTTPPPPAHSPTPQTKRELAMPTESDTIRSSDAVRELSATHGPSRITARRFHTMILDAKIPAVRGVDGRFVINRSDLPAIAEICGMTAKRSVA